MVKMLSQLSRSYAPPPYPPIQGGPDPPGVRRSNFASGPSQKHIRSYEQREGNMKINMTATLCHDVQKGS